MGFVGACHKGRQHANLRSGDHRGGSNPGGFIRFGAGADIPGRRPAKVKITISRETTVISGPVNPDGTINYMAALEADHEYLKAGGVFSEDLIRAWITYKRDNELKPMALRPHPYEFHLYYDS